MKSWQRRLARINTWTHIGIRIRVSNCNGELLEADSDHLYWTACYSGQVTPCTPACPPFCDRHGWLELIPGQDLPYRYPDDMPVPARLKIEVKPVLLPDPD